MPFNLTVVSPRGNGNVKLVCEFERLPKGNVVIPNGLHFKEYVRNSEVFEKWATSVVVRNHRTATAEQRRNARLVFHHLLTKDYSARACCSRGSVYLRTPPIDQLDDSGKVRILCCFRSPLRQVDSCGSSGDDKEMSPIADNSTTSKCQSSTIQAERWLLKASKRWREERAMSLPVDPRKARSPARVTSSSIKSSDESKMIADGRVVNMESSKCGKQNAALEDEKPYVHDPSWTCSLHSKPNSKPCTSKKQALDSLRNKLDNIKTIRIFQSRLRQRRKRRLFSLGRKEKTNAPKKHCCDQANAIIKPSQPATIGPHSNDCTNAFLADWREKLKELHNSRHGGDNVPQKSVVNPKYKGKHTSGRRLDIGLKWARQDRRQRRSSRKHGYTGRGDKQDLCQKRATKISRKRKLIAAQNVGTKQHCLKPNTARVCTPHADPTETSNHTDFDLDKIINISRLF